ncbi:MAG TPA: hypothetical protein VLL05_02680 [Terriglobales bacterium]|nr:hypothetical protein [Terriglobales bacterium]
MAQSPIRTSLYRRAGRAVICALLACVVAQTASAQVAKKTRETKGPRALGLLELSSDGNARLVPIAIMVDGKFYDAGAYKASPVPLALWSQTVYEAEKTGVPQGLFTVGEAMRTGPSIWFGQGKWVPAGSEHKAHRAPSKPKTDEEEGPPKLRRADSEKSDSSIKSAPPSSTPPADDKKTAPSSGSPTASTTPAPASAPTPSAPKPDGSPKDSAGEKLEDVAPPTDANDDDPNRPVLKRGKPETESMAHPQVGASTGVLRRPSDAKKADAKKVTTQAIPAISDAGGPDPRPYAYDIKPDEEQKYRKGMLALASDALLARIKEATPSVPSTKPAARTSTARKPARGPQQPVFEDVQFHAFDLWNTNEPVFILSATAHMPDSKGGSADPAQQYFITLVAKKNIYDELRKLYAGVTDAHHLDETPRLDLVDAVDADGDGRGELLFRRVSDAGSAWGVYRAGADQLFPLFEGTPPGQ